MFPIDCRAQCGLIAGMKRIAALAVLLAACGVAFGQKAAFDVASIRENKSNEKPYMNFPLNPQPQYNHTGGLLSARNVPLLQLLVFAYAKNMYQIQGMRQQLPDWARYTKYDVQARVEGEPTKNEMRAMMRTLLEDRFALKTHVEARTVPVYKLVEAKAGKTGARLKPYSESEAPCVSEAPEWGKPSSESTAATVEGGYPAWCGGVVLLRSERPGVMKAGGRRISMNDLAIAVGGVGDVVDRPVVDGTGWTGTFDMVLEFSPDPPDPSRAGSEVPLGPLLSEALKDQLGLKMVGGKAAVDVVVLDRVGKPSEN